MESEVQGCGIKRFCRFGSRVLESCSNPDVTPIWTTRDPKRKRKLRVLGVMVIPKP